MDLSPRHPPSLHTAGQAGGKRLHRELQRQVPRRVLERAWITSLIEARVLTEAWRDRVQPRGASQFDRRRHARGIRAVLACRRGPNQAKSTRRFRIESVLNTGSRSPRAVARGRVALHLHHVATDDRTLGRCRRSSAVTGVELASATTQLMRTLDAATLTEGPAIRYGIPKW